MSVDRTSTVSFSLALVLHIVIGLAFSRWSFQPTQTAQIPLLMEVTLAGSSAPKSASQGVKGPGAIGASQDTSESAPAMSAEQIRAWRAKKRQEIIKELAKTRSKVGIGANSSVLRQEEKKLAAGRGAGDWGAPGSPLGTLSLTGSIAARGYREPDFSVLKQLITEETQLRVTIIVLPSGEVKKALLYETSGYPFVDQKALELTRKITFDPLPADWQQVEQQGVLTIKLKL